MTGTWLTEVPENHRCNLPGSIEMYGHELGDRWQCGACLLVWRLSLLTSTQEDRIWEAES